MKLFSKYGKNAYKNVDSAPHCLNEPWRVRSWIRSTKPVCDWPLNDCRQSWRICFLKSRGPFPTIPQRSLYFHPLLSFPSVPIVSSLLFLGSPNFSSISKIYTHLHVTVLHRDVALITLTSSLLDKFMYSPLSTIQMQIFSARIESEGP